MSFDDKFITPLEPTDWYGVGKFVLSFEPFGGNK